MQFRTVRAKGRQRYLDYAHHEEIGIDAAVGKGEETIHRLLGRQTFRPKIMGK